MSAKCNELSAQVRKYLNVFSEQEQTIQYASTGYDLSINKKLIWCWQTRATRLEVSPGHQT